MSRPPPTRSAMTIIETLLSLALLATLMGALASWVSGSMNAYRDISEQQRWRAAAEATLDRIGDDLMAGVFLPNSDGLVTRRLESESDTLRIESRSFKGGAASVEYWFDAREGTVTRDERKKSPREEIASVLLDSVDTFTVQIEMIDSDESIMHAVATITLSSTDGLTADRVWRRVLIGGEP